MDDRHMHYFQLLMQFLQVSILLHLLIETDVAGDGHK